MKFTKVSGSRYEVTNEDDDVVFTIKRKNALHYVVRHASGDENMTLAFVYLQDAKKYIRSHKENWFAFFRRHTQGRLFENKKAVNQHMKDLAEKWRNTNKKDT